MKCDPISREKMMRRGQHQHDPDIEISDKDIKADSISMINEVKDICL